MPGGAQVPEWILKFIAENIHTEEACRDVKTARACLETWSADKKQRCPQIQREDLLPLIYTVCLQRAPAGEAKEMFLRLSEATLTACNMSKLNPEFEMDAILLSYIEKEEVYWYGDICEEMGGAVVAKSAAAVFFVRFLYFKFIERKILPSTSIEPLVTTQHPIFHHKVIE